MAAQILFDLESLLIPISECLVVNLVPPYEINKHVTEKYCSIYNMRVEDRKHRDSSKKNRDDRR